MSDQFEVPDPIICSPYREPDSHWHLEAGREPDRRAGRRPAHYFYPAPPSDDPGATGGTGTLIELTLVNLVRRRLTEWRAAGYPGATRTTLELLNYWRRDGRQHRLFFAQLEAAETIVFLTEARRDFLQGLEVPADEPSDKQKAELGYRAFRRYACKMATGSGKTTVMALLAAWSILNKVHDRTSARYSDVVLVVCPNVTIRSRLQEIDPQEGPASVYRTRDLVPEHLMADLAKGRVLVTNWHVFEPQGMQTGGASARVSKAGVLRRTREHITIGAKTTTARGRRYLTQEEYDRQVNAGLITVIDEDTDKDGNLSRVYVEAERYVESDTALVTRVLGREVGGKQNIIVFNDEAHHAYRIRREEPDPDETDLLGEADEANDFYKEATVWVEGWTVSTSCVVSTAASTSRRRPLPGPRRAGHEPAVPVGGLGLLADRRDRIRPGEDPAAGGAGHDRRGGARLLQRLEMDPPAADAGGARREEGIAEARGDPQVLEHADCDAGRVVGRGPRGVGAAPGRSAAAGVHRRRQEHRHRQGAVRVAGRQHTSTRR